MIERAVINAVRDAIFIADIETGMLVDANPAAEVLCGRSVAELRLLHHTQLHPESAELARQGFQSFAQDPAVTEGLVLHKNGRRIPVEISSGTFIGRDGKPKMIGVFRDITERAAAREALRRIEERFRHVAENAGEFIWEVDANGLYIYANPVVEQILGYTPDEVVGKMHFYDLFDPESRDEMKSAAFEVFRRREPFRAFLNWNVRKDGTMVALETSGAPVLGENGELLGYRGADTDVTARKRAEEILAASEEKYRALVEATGTGYLILDKEGNVLDANREYVRLTGHQELREILGRSVIEWTAPYEKRKNAEAVARCVKDGFVRNFAVDYVDGNGCITPIEVNARVIGSGESIRIVSLCRDITERKHAEEALRRSERIYRAIGESIDYGVWVCAPDGRNTYASESFLKLVGLTQEQCSNFGWGEVLHPDDAERTIAAWKECVRTEGRWDIEHRFRGVDGEWHPVLARGVPVRDEAGQIICWAGINLDIRALKQVQESLGASEAQARAATAELQAIMDAAPAVIITAHDQEGRYLGGNRTAHTLLRQPPGSNLSRDAAQDRPENFRLIRDGIEVSQSERPLLKVASTGEALRNYEVQVLFEDGASIDLLGNVEPLLDDTGRPQGAVAVLCDITERKKAEEALRESEKQLASIYDTVQDVIFHLAVEAEGQFRFVSVNPEFLRVTGLRREAVIGKTANEVIPEPSLTMVLSKYRQAVEENTIVSWEETSDYPRARLTGEVSVAPVFDNNGVCTHLVGSVHDITERERAEAKLRESEERFRTVADTAPVMIWMSGLDRLCTFFNKPWLEFTGRTIEQEMGDGWASGVHPDDLGRCLSTYSSSFDARQTFRMEYRLRRADGEYRWILDTGTPRYREGEFAGYIGSCIDMTERKQVEEELRSKHAQLMDSQRLAKVGSWDLDLATGALRWSDEMYGIFGLPEDIRLDFEMFLSRVHPKDRGTITESEKKALATHAPLTLEFRIVRPDGEVRFIRSVVESFLSSDGKPARFAGAAQDVTEQVNATERLRESEARLKNAERMTHVGNWIWDIKTHRVSWSEEILRIMGQPEDQQPDPETPLQMILPVDRDRVGQWAKDCLTRKKGGRIEARMVRPDGDIRTLVCTSEVLLDAEGAPECMFGACQDVTDARRAQEESFARQKLESLGTLASGIAHDFNNLMGAVLAQAELATADLAAGSSPDGELQEIRDVAIRGSEIVRQLMIYAGKEGDVLEAVDISRAVEGMMGLLKVAVSRHATLLTDLGRNLPAVKARAAQIRQIVMNLVVNASDAMKDHDGVIRVSTGCVTVVHDTAGAAPDGLAEGQYVQLDVSDTGCGMSPETQARIFEPFFTTKSAGRGLGLAVIHGIVRNLNGTIRVVSELGKGTTFQVLLPCAGAPSGATADAGGGLAKIAPPSQGSTVLIVEDEDTLRLPVARMLGKIGFKVLEAADGFVAIELLRTKAGEVDVVLLDMTIPGAPSHEVLAEAVRIRPDLKVILTSAYSEEMARTILDAPQVCGFVRKPFRFESLVREFRTALWPEGDS